MFLLPKLIQNQLDVFPQWREWAAGRWFCSVGLTVSVPTGTLWTISTPAPWAPGPCQMVSTWSSSLQQVQQQVRRLVIWWGLEVRTCVCVCYGRVLMHVCLCEQACWCGRFSRRERRRLRTAPIWRWWRRWRRADVSTGLTGRLRTSTTSCTAAGMRWDTHTLHNSYTTHLHRLRSFWKSLSLQIWVDRFLWSSNQLYLYSAFNNQSIFTVLDSKIVCQ